MRCALIGLGMAALPHAKSLLDLKDRVDVAGAYSPTAARRDAFAQQHGLPVTDDLDGLIADPSVDYAVLLTPPNARLDLVRRLTDAGKHILMEKPVERTTAAATEIVNLAERAGIQLGIVFQHRFRPVSERLATIVRDGTLGDTAAVNIMVPWWRPQSYYDEPGRGTYARDGGGVLLSQAIHSMDLALSLAGQADDVAAVAGTTNTHSLEAEDFAAAALRFPNGVFGALMATTSFYPGKTERIEVLGARGTAVLTNTGLTVSYLDGTAENLGESTESGDGGGGADPMAFPHDAHRALHADFLDAVASKRPPRVSGREALRVHHFIDAVIESAKTGTRVAVATQ